MNFSSLILKIVNIYLIVFLYRQYKKSEEEKAIKEEEEENAIKEEEEEEDNDLDTWYPISAIQGRMEGRRPT